jgi:hypothetical protein
MPATFERQKVLIPPGKPQLQQFDAKGCTVVVQTPREHAIQVTRHWNDEKGTSEICECDVPCRTQRTDTFVSGLVWVSESVWEQRLIKLTDQAVSTIDRLTAMKSDAVPSWKGLGLFLRRHGDRNNGRVTVEYRHWSNSVPEGFDVAYAVQVVTGIAVVFFGAPLSEPSVPNADQVVTPARARADKPRVSKGCGNCHKPKHPLQ